MFRTTLTAAALTAAAALAGASTGTAHADITVYGDRGDHSATAFLAELRAAGGTGTASAAADLAYQVCAKRGAGYSEDELIGRLDSGGYSVELSVEAVMGGEYHFCPTYESTYPGSTSPSPGGSNTSYLPELR